jgi:hypothetical protein
MVVPDGLPSDVVQFVNDTVDSIEQLELLVMLIESSDRWWHAVSAGGALGVNPGTTQRDLERLSLSSILLTRGSVPQPL